MPPFTQIVRRDSSGARQSLVTNVDTAMLTMGLDGDFNMRRLERYLAMVKPAGIWPIVILTKRDLCNDVDQRLDALRERLPHDLAVHAVDTRAAATASELAPYLGVGQTTVVLGSSGAGKSTLTNTLLGTQVQSTGAVRADDSRGRHTTTSRSLHLLPTGGCVIDTPGLRGLRPDIDEDDLAATFDDIRALAEHCRFRDCHHQGEPGCAVRCRRRRRSPDQLPEAAARDSARDADAAAKARAIVNVEDSTPRSRAANENEAWQGRLAIASRSATAVCSSPYRRFRLRLPVETAIHAGFLALHRKRVACGS